MYIKIHEIYFLKKDRFKTFTKAMEWLERRGYTSYSSGFIEDGDSVKIINIVSINDEELNEGDRERNSIPPSRLCPLFLPLLGLRVVFGIYFEFTDLNLGEVVVKSIAFGIDSWSPEVISEYYGNNKKYHCLINFRNQIKIPIYTSNTFNNDYRLYLFPSKNPIEISLGVIRS